MYPRTHAIHELNLLFTQDKTLPFLVYAWLTPVNQANHIAELVVRRSLKTERRPVLKKVKFWVILMWRSTPVINDSEFAFFFCDVRFNGGYSILVSDKGVICTIAIHRAPKKLFELDPGASKVVPNAKGPQSWHTL